MMMRNGSSSIRSGGNNNSSSSSSSSNSNSMNISSRGRRFLDQMKQRRSRRTMQRNGGAVGTEAVAKEELERNRRHFSYPSEGFVTPIEYTLLYAMMREPTIYPSDVIRSTIVQVTGGGGGGADEEEEEEDGWESYILVNDGNHHHHSNSSSRTTTTTMTDAPISYAQLSALIALAGEKFPSKDEDNSKTSTKTTNNTKNRDQQSDNSNNKQDESSMSIPQFLCKHILQFVVRYAEEHDRDRRVEIQKLMEPISIHVTKRLGRASMAHIIPVYLGNTLSVITGNPLLMILGLAAFAHLEQTSGIHEERQNVEHLASQVRRKADVERVSLLEEAADDVL